MTAHPDPAFEVDALEAEVRELRAELASARRANDRQDAITKALLAVLGAIEQVAKEALWEGANALDISTLRNLLLSAPRALLIGVEPMVLLTRDDAHLLLLALGAEPWNPYRGIAFGSDAYEHLRGLAMEDIVERLLAAANHPVTTYGDST